MQPFHMFKDTAGKVVAIENAPSALDLAPYDRIIERFTGPLADEDQVTELINRFGGEIIYADYESISVSVY